MTAAASDAAGRARLRDSALKGFIMTNRTERIRTLNDDLRRHLSRHSELAFMTPGIAALGAEAVARIVKTVATYDDFCHANDPYEEHDFGSFEANGTLIYFKIDYYDPDAERPLCRPIRSVDYPARADDHACRRVLRSDRPASDPLLPYPAK